MINIDELIKKATLSKDRIALNAYRNIKAEFEKFKYAQKLTRNLTEEIELRIISSYTKKLEDSIQQFSEANRDDLVAEYTSELDIVKTLLPEPVSTEEMFSELSNWCVENGFCSEVEEFIIMPEGKKSSGRTLQLPKKEMGNAIKYLKSKFPTADGKTISIIVKGIII